MRVYLPATLPALAGALRAAEIGPAPMQAFTVTPALREWYAQGDLEELEYAALTHAARASLWLLLADPAAPRRRVVLAVDVPEEQVGRDGGFGGGFEEPTRVLLSAPVPLARVVSGHVDDLTAVPDVSAAVAALGAAEAGDDDAQFLVDGAEGHELMWYATQELPFVAGNAG
jgi:hypothetical protein